MDEHLAWVVRRLDGVEARLGQIDRVPLRNADRLDEVDRRILALERKVDVLEGKIEAIDKRARGLNGSNGLNPWHLLDQPLLKLMLFAILALFAYLVTGKLGGLGGGLGG